MSKQHMSRDKDDEEDLDFPCRMNCLGKRCEEDMYMNKKVYDHLKKNLSSSCIVNEGNGVEFTIDVPIKSGTDKVRIFVNNGYTYGPQPKDNLWARLYMYYDDTQKINLEDKIYTDDLLKVIKDIIDG